MTSFPIPQGDGLTPEKAVAYYQSSLFYENRAGDKKLADRVKGEVEPLFTGFESSVLDIWERWKRIGDSLRGRSAARRLPVDMTSGELYQMVENLVPRIAEAILEFDPWFRLRGRDAMDKAVVHVREALYDYQLDQMQFLDKVEPILRTMVPYQLCMLKWYWRTDIEWQRKRTIQRDNGVPIARQVTEEEVVTFDGPDCEIVDSYDMLFDNNENDPQKCRFVGDQFLMDENELRHMARMGRYSNGQVDELIKNVTPFEFNTQGSAGRNEHYKRSRSVTNRWLPKLGHDDSKNSKNTMRLWKIREVWKQFDIDNDGKLKWCVLTVGEDLHVLEARRAFYDRLRHPYAIGRMAREAKDMVNMGILDIALKVEAQKDRHEAQMTRVQALQVPIVFASSRSDLMPETIFDLEEGQIIQDAGDVQFAQTPGLSPTSFAFTEMLSRRIEQLAGAPRVFEGQESGNTATEVERRTREANRRVKGMVRAFGNLGKQSLRIIDAMNRQFLVEETVFPVIGKRGDLLVGDRQHANPEIFTSDVDFEIVGLENLHTVGARATGIMTWLNAFGALIPNNPDVANQGRLMQIGWDLMVGRNMGDEIIRPMDNAEDRKPQSEENEHLKAGHQVLVHPQDDHEQHLESMVEQLMEPGPDGQPVVKQVYSERAQQMILEHFGDHLLELERQETVRGVQQRQQQNLPPEAGGQPAASPVRGGSELPGQQTGQSPGPTTPNNQPRGGRNGAPQQFPSIT